MAGVYVFVGAGKSGDRIVCNAWKIRPDGAFEAETNSGTMLFRLKDMQMIEAHPSELEGHAWVCIGSLRRMVWIDFPSEMEAQHFVSQMGQYMTSARF